MLLPHRLDVNVQAEQAKSAEAPFVNVDGGSEATTACFSRLLLLSLALQRRAGADFSTTDNDKVSLWCWLGSERGSYEKRYSS